MVLTALRGAAGFLTRVPVGHEQRAWEAFRETPAAFPLAGYAVGAVVALPLVLPVPPPTSAVLFVAAVYFLTGITHLDGLVDLGDAAVVHGPPERRREVLADTAVGVGGVLVAALAVFALGGAALALAALPPRAALLAVAAEVAAKTGMAGLACLGSATHEGLGSQLTSRLGPRAFLGPAVLAAPTGLLVWPNPAATVALLAGVSGALAVLVYARRRLGGVTGDVLGAANEISRLVALHVGVVAWTQF